MKQSRQATAAIRKMTTRQTKATPLRRPRRTLVRSVLGHIFRATWRCLIWPHTGPGRRGNLVVEFDPTHPLAATHHQRLRSKFLVPLLAGRPPPAAPGPAPLGDERAYAKWKEAADKFGAFCLTVFCPWDLETHAPPYPLTFAGLSDWMQELQERDDPLSRCRLQWIKNLEVHHSNAEGACILLW